MSLRRSDLCATTRDRSTDLIFNAEKSVFVVNTRGTTIGEHRFQTATQSHPDVIVGTAFSIGNHAIGVLVAVACKRWLSLDGAWPLAC